MSYFYNPKCASPLTVTGHVFGRSTRKVKATSYYPPISYSDFRRINATITFESPETPGIPTFLRCVSPSASPLMFHWRTRSYGASRSTRNTLRSIGKQVVAALLRLSLLRNGASSLSESHCAEATLLSFWTPTGKEFEYTTPAPHPTETLQEPFQ